MPPVPPGDAGGLAQVQHLPQFHHYLIGRGYDEMFDGDGGTREHYAALYARLEITPGDALSTLDAAVVAAPWTSEVKADENVPESRQRSQARSASLSIVSMSSRLAAQPLGPGSRASRLPGLAVSKQRAMPVMTMTWGAERGNARLKYA